MKRSIAFQLVFLAVASAGALGLTCCKKTSDETPEATVSVQAAHPVRGPLAQEIAADALLAPLSQAALSPRISAPIRTEYVQRGDHVRRGQLLVVLEDRDLRGSALDSKGAFLAAQANFTATTQATVPEEVTKAKADVVQSKTAFNVAHTTAEERKRLFAQGAIAGRDVDTAVAAEAQAKAAYETAEIRAKDIERTTRNTDTAAANGQLTSARGRLENADAQVSYANLRSPIDGVVTERPLFPGETATAGSPVITVMDTTSLLAKLHLAQSAAQQLAPGSRADLHIQGLNEPVEATVSFISPVLDPGSTTVEVWLKLPNPDGRFKVGTSVHAVLFGRTLPDALQVPPEAIVPGREGGSAVMLVGSDGTAHQRVVTVGIRTMEAVQILSGITTSDIVITEGGYGLDDGTKVDVKKPGSGDAPSANDGEDRR